MGSRGGGFVRCAHCQGQAHRGPHRPPGPNQATWRISDNLKTGWPSVMHRLLTVVLLAASLPCCLGYCRSLGWNPSFNGPPLVEQLTLTSVRVSWAGKLEQAECADNIIVKHYKGINSNDYHLSEPLPTEVTSYVVLDLTPNIEYTYQVIAREEKGLWGVDYNRGEKTTFATSIQNRDQGRQVHLEDPVRESHLESNGNVTTREYNPVYDVSQRPKQLVAGIQIELLVALIIALMVVCVVCIGLLYNCLRRRAPVKDLELNDSKYDGEGDDEEESEEDEEEDGIDVEEFEDNGRETKKFDMMEQMTQKLERPKLLRPISVA